MDNVRHFDLNQLVGRTVSGAAGDDKSLALLFADGDTLAVVGPGGLCTSLLTAEPRPYLGVPRHKDWPKVRAAHVKAHPSCAACGRREHLEVHHIVPFHERPDLELVPANLLTLCDAPPRSCHLALGHLFSWSSWNPGVREDAAEFLRKVQNRKTS